MTTIEYELEQHYKSIAKRPLRKDEDTITKFDRNIYLYNIDEVPRQQEANERAIKQTTNYEDHRKVVETAVTMLKQHTQHDIAMTILTHRFFADYRSKTFAGKGNFTIDYTFIIKKVGALFSHNTETVTKSSIAMKLAEYTKPTLVQVNHLAGIVSEVSKLPWNTTLNDQAIKLNFGAPESTSYMVAGLKL